LIKATIGETIGAGVADGGARIMPSTQNLSLRKSTPGGWAGGALEQVQMPFQP